MKPWMNIFFSIFLVFLTLSVGIWLFRGSLISRPGPDSAPQPEKPAAGPSDSVENPVSPPIPPSGFSAPQAQAASQIQDTGTQETFPLIDQKFRKKRYDLALKGDLEAILELYEAYGLDINTSYADLINRPLFIYLLATNPDLAMELWETGLVDRDRTEGAVRVIILTGKTDLLAFALENGMEPFDGMTEDLSMSPLMSAVIHNRLEMVFMLEAYGMDIFEPVNGQTAMDFAVRSKFIEADMLDYLLDTGFQYSQEHIFLTVQKNRPVALAHILANRPDLGNMVTGGKNLLDLAVSGEAGPQVIGTLLANGFVLTPDHLAMAEKRLADTEADATSGKGLRHITDREAEDVCAYLRQLLNPPDTPAD